jgi:hypothetical protein
MNAPLQPAAPRAQAVARAAVMELERARVVECGIGNIRYLGGRWED